MNTTLLILFIGFFTLASCKKETPILGDEFKPAKATIAEKTQEESTVARVTLGKTNLSLISERPFEYDASISVLTDEDKVNYTYKEAYFYETNSRSYVLVNYSLAKDDIELSLIGGIEGALSNLATTMNATIVDRVDTNIAKTIGHPALYSKGLAKSNNSGGTDLEYRVVITNKDQKLYMIIGIFPPNQTKDIADFETMVETIQIN